MAEKRMFSSNVVWTDWFLSMPLSTQALYFHLSMQADDDGFVDKPKTIMKTICASQNDYDLLIAKRFILEFESGVIVIKHWRMNNYIRNDRYKPTRFKKEINVLELNANGSYTEKNKNDACWLSSGIPSGNQVVYPEYSKTNTNTNSNINTNSNSNSNSNNNIFIMSNEPSENGSNSSNEPSENGSNSSNEPSENGSNNKINELFNQFWNAYPKKQKKSTCLKWFEKNKPTQELVNKMINTIENFKYSDQWTKDNGQYIPLPSTWLNGGCWDDEVDINLEKSKDVINTTQANTTKKVKDMNTEEQEEWAKSIYGYNISYSEIHKIIMQKINEEIIEENTSEQTNLSVEELEELMEGI